MTIPTDPTGTPTGSQPPQPRTSDAPPPGAPPAAAPQAQAYMGAPPAFQPPPVAYPVAPPAPAQKLSEKFIAIVVVVVVVIAGGITAAVSLSGGKHQLPGVAQAGSLGNGKLGNGGLSQPANQPAATQPGLPAQPAASQPAQPVQPPADQPTQPAPNQPTQPNQPAQPAGGAPITLANGATLVPASGWQIQHQDSTTVVLASPDQSTEFAVFAVTPTGTDVNQGVLNFANQWAQANDAQDTAVADPSGPTSTGGQNFPQLSQMEFQTVLAGQQGTIQLYGQFLYLLNANTGNALFIVLGSVKQQATDSILNDANAMLSSMV